MKIIKLFLITASMLIADSSFAAETVALTADPFPVERPGQYVYYHDMRTGIYGNKEPLNRLMGILKTADKKYLIRIYYPSSGKTFYFSGSYVLNKGVMEFTPENIQGEAKEGTMIMADLLNLMNYLGAGTLKHAQKLKGKKDFSVGSDWVNYNLKLVNSYKWWAPFYKLTSSVNAGTDKSSAKGNSILKLVCFGSVYDEDAETFAQISKLPVYYNEKSAPGKYLIPAADKVEVKLAGFSLALDKNWVYEKPDPAAGMMHETYWLKKFTVRDAQIGIETIDVSNMLIEKNEIDSFAATLQFQTCVITDTVNIDHAKKAMTLCLWDPKSGSGTLTVYRSLGIKNKSLMLLNFSAFDFIYYANMEYFNAIMNFRNK